MSKLETRVYDFQITDHRKQLGRCPQCGNESINLTELAEWAMCAPCYIKVLRKAFDLLAADYTMEQLLKETLWDRLTKDVGVEKVKDIKVYFPESQMPDEVKDLFKKYMEQASK